MKRWAVLIVVLAIAAAALIIGGRTAIPASHALVFESRLGGRPGVATGASHWVLPLLYSKHVYPLGSRSDTLSFEPGAFRTAESEPVGLDVIVRYDIRPENLPAIHVSSRGDPDRALRAAVLEGLRPLVERKPAYEIFRSGLGGVPEDLLAVLRGTASLAPFAIAEVELSAPRFDPTTERGMLADYAGENHSAAKIVIVGVDGADWGIIDPMIAEGQLPNFARLVREGTRARFESIQPMLSPRIWTSMATGKFPQEHGITDFVIKDPSTGRMLPVTSNMRRCRALWNILSDLGIPVGFIGWLATWPAEEVDGFMVSDRMAYYAFSPDRPLDASPRKTYPDELFESLRPLVKDHKDIRYEDVRRFVHIPAEEYRRNSAGSFDLEDPIHNLELILATTETYRKIALRQLREPVRLFSVYFELVDAMSHLFMRYMPPRLAQVSDENFARFRDVIYETYRYQDEILGEIMDRLDKGTILIVLSDHGFRTGSQRLVEDPIGSPAAMLQVGHGGRAARAILDHAPFGILAMSGPGIRRGARIENASVMDVAPTVLYLLGLPVARDMEGHVLADALEPGTFARNPVVTIASYETGEPRSEDTTPIASGDDSALLEKLAALGYVSPDAGEDPAVQGARLLRSGNAEAAIAPLREAARANPQSAGSWANLGLACLKTGRADEAAGAFERALEIKPDSPMVLSNMAVLLTRKERYEEAARALEKAVRLSPDNPEMRDNLGVLYVHLGRTDDARREFARAIELDPRMAEPYSNLGAVALEEKDYRAARTQLTKAVELSPGLLEAHLNLARVELESGSAEDALARLQRALEIDPDCVEALYDAGLAYKKMGETERARVAWKRAAELDPGGDFGGRAAALLKE